MDDVEVFAVLEGSFFVPVGRKSGTLYLYSGNYHVDYGGSISVSWENIIQIPLVSVRG